MQARVTKAKAKRRKQKQCGLHPARVSTLIATVLVKHTHTREFRLWPRTTCQKRWRIDGVRLHQQNRNSKDKSRAMADKNRRQLMCCIDNSENINNLLRSIHCHCLVSDAFYKHNNSISFWYWSKHWCQVSLFPDISVLFHFPEICPILCAQ